MNSNKTLRAITSKHAGKLNNILRSLAEKQKFDKFDVHFVENPFQSVLDQWVKDGGDIYQARVIKILVNFLYFFHILNSVIGS